MTYKIKDWDKLYENNRTRHLKTLTWFPVQNKHDGDGYTTLVCDHPNGETHYGAWIAILAVASKCEPRGTLVRSTGEGNVPHDAHSLSRCTRYRVKTITEVIQRVLQIGWLEEVTEIGHEGAGIGHESAQIGHSSARIGHEGAGIGHLSAGIGHSTDYGMEWNGMEGKGREEEGPPTPQGGQPASPDEEDEDKEPVIWDKKQFHIPPATLARWCDAYPNLDVPVVIAGAAQWRIEHPKKRYKIEKQFLGNWVRREFLLRSRPPPGAPAINSAQDEYFGQVLAKRNANATPDSQSGTSA